MPIIHCDQPCFHNDNSDDYCRSKRKDRIYWVRGRCSRFRPRLKSTPPPAATLPEVSAIVHEAVRPGYKKHGRWAENRNKGIR